MYADFFEGFIESEDIEFSFFVNCVIFANRVVVDIGCGDFVMYINIFVLEVAKFEVKHYHNGEYAVKWEFPYEVFVFDNDIFFSVEVKDSAEDVIFCSMVDVTVNELETFIGDKESPL